MSSASDFSILSDTAQTFIILDFFFIGGIGLTLSILIYFGLNNIYEQNKNNKNKYYLYAIKCVKLSIIASILFHLSKVLILSDLIIPWNFNNRFVSINDSFLNLWYGIGKISFCYGFTFHIESLLNFNNDYQMSKFIKLWMMLAGLILCILGILYVVEDVIIYTKKEIGITPNGFHIAMFLGHEGVGDLMPYIFFGIIVINILYFFVLLYRYISYTKKMQSNNYNLEEGVKGTVLILITCIIFWVLLIVVILDLDIKYGLASIDVISDDICLFLMFKSNQKLYHKLCGWLCNKCCTKIIYSSTEEIPLTQIPSEEESDHDLL